MANFEEDLRSLERFFLDVLSQRIDEAAARDRAMSFYGVQGPWYTVGWGMAVVIERAFGRDRLVETLCNPVALLTTYNAAVGVAQAMPADAASSVAPARWSMELLDLIAATSASSAN